MALPFDIIANEKTGKLTIPAGGIVINSGSPPQVDSGEFYLNKITIQ